jgi:Flp pilus assembly protein TadD
MGRLTVPDRAPGTRAEPLAAMLGRARQQAASGDLHGAIELARRCTELYPRDYRSWYAASDLLLRGQRTADAVQAGRKAAALQPADSGVQVQLARAFAADGDVANARRTADIALGLEPRDAALLDGLGAVYSACDEQSLALDLFRRATALAPRNPHFLFNLATALRFAGDFAAAETAVDAAIAGNPRDPGAWHLRSYLRRQTRDRNHVAELEAMLGDPDITGLGRVQLLYALAKELEDLGDYERSFATLEEGACLRRKGMRYDVANDVHTIDRIIELHDASALAQLGPGQETREPLFVLGLPRTGTTLVERILGNHSTVVAAGELRQFPEQMVRFARASLGGHDLPRDELVAHTLKLDMRELGRRYVESTRPRTGARPHFVDKLPLNYLYCGLIHRSLPGARIVHLRRHPLDACYAIYKTLFARAYPFSYDLGELAQYYVAYDRLMTHWRTAMPGVIYDVHYEALVDDPEGETRRLLDHCGLEFEPVCLDFHRSPEASTTASALQVRQPIYRDSVSRWRNVAGQLEPLAQVLRSNGIDVG